MQQQGQQAGQSSGAPQEPPLVDYETVFTNAKAGMEGVDPEHVKRVVYEASKGSSHFDNEQRKNAATEAKIARMRAALAGTGAGQLAAAEERMNAKLAELEAGRDLTRIWLHVDMDAFFAAVEELDQPALRTCPFAVGGKAMISTANYVARKFGVRSAMPGFIARQLCPQLLFVEPDFEKYRRASEATRAIFRCYDPDFHTGSLDEAALDVTEYCAAQGLSGEQVAAQVRERVEAETRLTCSVGIAPNRMLAKICSDQNKPNGQFALDPSREAVMAFMHDLSIRKVPGVGKVTQKVLAAFGMHTGADLLQHRSLLGLEALFSAVSTDFFARVALGLGETRHPPQPPPGEVGRKGISHECTFRALSRRADLEVKLQELAGALAEDMAEEGLRGRTLTLKLKLTTFELRTRATTLPHYISSAGELYSAGLKLLHAEMPCTLRLLGLRVSNFLEPGKRQPGQPSLEEVLAAAAARQAGRGGAAGQQGGQAVPLASTTASSAAAAGGDVEEEDAVHTSQVLGQGDLVELTLRDWQPDGEDAVQLQQLQQGSDGSPGAAAEDWLECGEVSLPPSLAVSPATAARYEREAAAGGSDQLGSGAAAAVAGHLPRLPLHLPATGLDVMLQQAAGKLADLQGGGERGPQQQQQQQQPPPQQQQQTAAPPPPQQQPTWACGACTYANPKGAFWCEMCGTSRLPRRETAASAASGAAAMSSGKPPSSGRALSSSNKGSSGPGSSSGKGSGGGSSGKGKRGRRPGSVPTPGPSILRFVSSQRLPSPPAEQPTAQQQQQQQPPAADARQQQQEQPPAAAQEPNQQPPGQEHPQQQVQVEQLDQQQEEPPQQLALQQQHQAATAEAQEAQQQPAAEESDEEDYGLPPESPLLPGEDVLECNACGDWVRETRWQAHEDEHLAQKLQREEDKLGRLYAFSAGKAGSVPAKSGSSGGKKRAAAGKAGGGSGGRQGTLLAFAKRPKQQ